EVFWVDFDPEPNEKGDYLDLKKDFTYTSVDEGACDEGTWQLMKDDKGFILINNKGESLAFTIEELTENHLVVTAQVEDLIDVNIHFTSKNQ
ncbi:MAG: lipocalin family protein, partial [Bacteroidia bacterium]